MPTRPEDDPELRAIAEALGVSYDVDPDEPGLFATDDDLEGGADHSDLTADDLAEREAWHGMDAG